MRALMLFSLGNSVLRPERSRIAQRFHVFVAFKPEETGISGCVFTAFDGIGFRRIVERIAGALKAERYGEIEA